MGLRPFRLSIENVIARAGLKVKLGQTWSQNGPDMVPKNGLPIEMVLRPFGFSVENFSAPASLEVKLGQTWSQHGPDMVPKLDTP